MTGVAATVATIFTSFRIPFYLWYCVKSTLSNKYTLLSNPYNWDWAIAFPILSLNKRLSNNAYENSRAAYSFVGFLKSKRPHQIILAHQILHAADAGNLAKAALDRLSPEGFEVPRFPDDAGKYLPTDEWYTRMTTTRQARIDSSIESHIHTRIGKFNEFRAELDKLKNQTIRESSSWNGYYLKALARWEKAAAEEAARLELIAQTEEPVCQNIYRRGEKLDPRIDGDLFLGRDEVRRRFQNKVMEARTMPLFYIQGQRRTGKSTLINFLPTFLDSGFAVVAFDCQEGVRSIGGFWAALLREVRRGLSRPGEQTGAAPDMPEGWLDAFDIFRSEVDRLAEAKGKRIILAIDEVEELHRCLLTDPAQGEQLLGAMRAWSQAQSRVVFLLAGADFLSELRGPDWANFFTQAERLRIDWLDRADTERLMLATKRLTYDDGLLEKIWLDTQGHPAILQKIGSSFVEIANRKGSAHMAEADYATALRDAILHSDNGVINIFWNQFCANRELKPAVGAIAEGREIDDRRAIGLLSEHGFIVEKEGKWRLRGPLFERWVREFGYDV